MWIGITTGGESGKWIPTYCVINSSGEFEAYFGGKERWSFDRRATEEERQKLFQAIKDSGYKWNSETKTLEKIEPNFKVGDRIRHKKETKWTCVIRRVDDRYWVDGHPTCYTIPLDEQDEYELVPDKFDITTLVPFESRVLVRDSEMGIWLPDFFGCFDNSNECPYMVVGGIRWKYCIPFEGNQHLLGTTDDCDEFYKTWTNEED